MIILENQLLNDKMFSMPKDLIDHLKLILNNHTNDKDSKGYKRLNSLINSNYNKRNDLKNDVRYISYSDLKRINHDFDNMPHNPKNLEFILNGGELMNNWVKQTLSNSRDSVKSQLKKIKNDTLRKNRVKAYKNPTKPVDIKAELNSITEDVDYTNHPYTERLEEYNAYYVFSCLEENYNLWTPLINPMMYKKALDEFVKFGYIANFPTKYIYQWFGIIMKNTATLRACTEIAGHDSYLPIEDFIDAFFNGDENEFNEYKDENGFEDDFDAYDNFCGENGIYDKLQLPDGSDAWSDFGIEPLEKLIGEYNSDMSPEKVLVLINRILDITHQRGDLSSIFIDGGAKTLNRISNNESVIKNKKIYIRESQLDELRQQLNLPFDGNKEKMTYEHFIDWLESKGKYGRLEPSKVTFESLLNKALSSDLKHVMEMCMDNIDLLRDITNYLLSDLSSEEIANMLDVNDDFEKENMSNEIKENYDSETFLDNINDNGFNYLEKEIPNYISNMLYDNDFKVNSNKDNLVMIERVIELPKLLDNTEDFYSILNKEYDGIGNFWSYDKGEAYCSRYTGDEITIKALVSPSIIDIDRTIYCAIYDLNNEKEIYIPSGVVEITEILTSDGKHLPLQNHLIINV